MLHYISHNGKILKDDKAIITADNRSFRYGDGLFETLKVIDGQIQLQQYHFERLFRGIDLLQFEKPAYFSEAFFSKQIIELCQQNQQAQLARVRLTIFRGNGSIYDLENNFPNYIVQTWKLPETLLELNEEGLLVDIYTYARKAVDSFSNCKSNNYLPYIMGAIYAKKAQMNDAIILNSYGRVCDSTIANVFIVKDGIIHTPALEEGCVEGIMRKWLLKQLPENGFKIQEGTITSQQVLEADEMFFTNSIFGLHWVKQCGTKQYENTIATNVFQKCIQPLNELKVKVQN